MSLNFNRFNTLGLATISSLALTLPLILTACGGSSDSSGSNPSNTVSSETYAQEISCTEASQQAMLDAINEVRSQGRYCYSASGKTFYQASSKLKWNAKLAQSASYYATDMAQNNYYNADHSDRNGNHSMERVTATGYGQGKQYAVGENIASGQATLEEVMQDWLTSKKGHCDSIMRSEIKDLGMACGYNENSQHKTYWVQNFGAIQ